MPPYSPCISPGSLKNWCYGQPRNLDMSNCLKPLQQDRVQCRRRKILMLSHLSGERLQDTAKEGYSTATDIAEYLARKGLPFRKAHEVTGRIVLYCSEKKKRFEDLTLTELRKFSSLISEDIYTVVTPEESVKRKKSI